MICKDEDSRPMKVLSVEFIIIVSQTVLPDTCWGLADLCRSHGVPVSFAEAEHSPSPYTRADNTKQTWANQNISTRSSDQSKLELTLVSTFFNRLTVCCLTPGDWLFRLKGKKWRISSISCLDSFSVLRWLSHSKPRASIRTWNYINSHNFPFGVLVPQKWHTLTCQIWIIKGSVKCNVVPVNLIMFVHQSLSH